jgi:HAMP domain-containing protein
VIQLSARPRRKISNLVIDRAALVRLSVPFALMALLSIGIVLAIRWRVLRALEQTELVGIENLAAINSLHVLQNSVTFMASVALAVLALSCLGMWVVFSHRIFGPTVPIRRHIQKLIAGDYSSRIRLRSGDEFKALAAELNTLAEKLEQGGR